MSPLRSTRMGSLPPCKDLCCSSASPFYHLAFFPLCLRFSDFAHSRYLRLRQVSSLTAGIFSHSRYLRLQQVSSFTAGIFVYSRYLRLRQVSSFTAGICVCAHGRTLCFRSQQKTLFGRTFPFLTKWFPPLSRGWHCPQGVLLARRRSASLLWQMVVRLLWFYLGTRGVPQNAVGASANSLWQGGRRRVHSVKGGLPK